MDKSVSGFLEQLRLGALTASGHVSVVPLFIKQESKLDYLLAQEAIEKKQVTVTEIGEEGSVPELRVTNHSLQQVLLLDGEELAGAKQNRVLNTSILLKARSETIIPVSCTEAGRWARRSAEFRHSGAMMARRAHAEKMRSVSASLAAMRTPRSNQRQVWGTIERMYGVAGSSSPTNAMRDLYQQKMTDLQKFSSAFLAEPGQVGSLVFVNGEIIGFDVLSRADAYRKVHRQLLESYVMDALLDGEKDGVPHTSDATRFLEKAMECREARYDGVGLGYDYRYDSPGMVGTALTHDDQVVHAAFFVNRQTRENSSSW